jgi:hypothetical protein
VPIEWLPTVCIDIKTFYNKEMLNRANREMDGILKACSESPANKAAIETALSRYRRGQHFEQTALSQSKNPEEQNLARFMEECRKMIDTIAWRNANTRTMPTGASKPDAPGL